MVLYSSAANDDYSISSVQQLLFSFHPLTLFPHHSKTYDFYSFSLFDLKDDISAPYSGKIKCT
jgi:hypothetical protein